MARPPSTRERRVLIAIRYGLPALVVLAAIVLFAVNPSIDAADGAAGLIGAGLSILLLNFLHRMGVSGDRDRDEERDARRFFDEHGYWPDDPPRRPPGAA